MTGSKKGVIAFLREKQPNVHLSGCTLHLIHIAAKHGAACLPPFEDILIEVYFYFKKSTNRQVQFQNLQELCGVDQLKMLKHGCTRWLSIGRCLQRLVANWEPLLRFFVDEKEKFSKDTQYYVKVEKLVSFLKSPTNKLFAVFLEYTVKVYDSALVSLQAEKPMIHCLRECLANLLQDVFSRFLLPTALYQKDVMQVDIFISYFSDNTPIM